MKSIVKTYYVLLFYPVLYFPYKVLNTYVIIKWLGCPCDYPRFNANHVTTIFWALVGLITLFLFIKNYLSTYRLNTRKNIIIFIVSFIFLIFYSFYLSKIFTSSMYWD